MTAVSLMKHCCKVVENSCLIRHYLLLSLTCLLTTFNGLIAQDIRILALGEADYLKAGPQYVQALNAAARNYGVDARFIEAQAIEELNSSIYSISHESRNDDLTEILQKVAGKKEPDIILLPLRFDSADTSENQGRPIGEFDAIVATMFRQFTNSTILLLSDDDAAYVLIEKYRDLGFEIDLIDSAKSVPGNQTDSMDIFGQAILMNDFMQSDILSEDINSTQLISPASAIARQERSNRPAFQMDAPGDNVVIDATFTSGLEGFSYVDSPNHPEYADGSLSGTGNPGNTLKLALGGVDRTGYYDGNENGWEIGFTGGGNVEITGEYNLIVTKDFESDEYGEVRLRIDGQLYGTDGNPYLAMLSGDNVQNQDHVSGWTAFTITVPGLASSAHTLKLAGYNNQKTRPNEIVEVYFDNIQVSVAPAGPDTLSPVVSITSPTGDATYTTGISPLGFAGSAIDNVDVTSVSWLNVESGGSGPATGTASWTIPSVDLLVGLNTIVVTASDAEGNTGTDTLGITYTPDVTAPVITGVVAENITSDAAVIRWDTDEGSTSQVEYGFDEFYGNMTAVDSSLTQSHMVGLMNLEADTTYHYRVHSGDGAGNPSVSANYTFTTPEVPPFTCVVDVDFESGTSGFSYVDSPNHSDFASGGLSGNGNPGNALQLTLGGVNGDDYTDGNENGWEISFTGGGTITISGQYNLFVVRHFEGDEYGEARLRVDGQLFGMNGNDYLAHLAGSDSEQSSDHVTGWLPFSVTLSDQADGNHVLRLAGFNNKKTATDETMHVEFDNIQVCLIPEGPDVIPPVVSITSPTGDATYTTGISPLGFAGSAIDNVDVTSVSWLNVESGGSGPATGTASWTIPSVDLLVGLNTIVVTASDAEGNTGTDTLGITYTPDVTAPVITGVVAENITSDAAVIRWDTDEGSTSQVEYGFDEFYGNMTAVDSSLTQSHMVGLMNLEADTTYHYRVHSGDGAGNPSVSANYTFTTPEVPPFTCVVDVDFESGTSGFSYVDSPNHSDFASGGLSGNGNPGNALQLTLGGVNGDDYTDGNENGWEISFTGGGTITISGQYNLFVVRHFEGDEYGEARLRVDGQLFGMNGNDYLAHLAGSDSEQSSDHVTGWLPFSVTLSDQADGNHVLRLAGYNNKKTATDETMHVEFDNIQVCLIPEGPDVIPPVVTITSPTSNSTYATGVSPVGLSGSASDNEDVTSVSWLNVESGGSGPATGTASWTIPSVDLQVGLNTIVVTASDAEGNTGTDTLGITYTPDVTAPVITGVVAENITSDAAVIRWDTDEGSTSQVEYGFDEFYGNMTAVDSSLTQSHMVGLMNLEADTTYHYRVHSGDGAGNPSVSANFIFTTPEVPPFTCVVDVDFESGADGFSYIDSPNHADFASGSLSGSGNPGQALQLELGGVNGDDYTDGNENGWEISFTGGETITITGQYNLFVVRHFEGDEFGEARVRLDGQLLGMNGNDYLARLTGSDSDQSSDHVTGWVPFSISVSGQAEGTHILRLAAYNNKKTASDEIVRLEFDNVQVCVAPDGPDTIPPGVNITSPTSSPTYFTGESPLALSGSASDNVDVTSVSWSNVESGGSGTATGTSSWSVAAVDLQDGLNRIVIAASDSMGNTGRDTIAVTYDSNFETVPPVISDISVANLASNSATIMWTTDEDADSQVEYGAFFAISGEIKIMPLGNSITRGKGSTPEHGFREDLYDLLINEGYDTNFVGSLNLGSGFDGDHEGHAGWTSYQIRDNIATWVQDEDPDIVLLHIGTNDVTWSTNPSSIANNIDLTLDDIWAHNANIHVIISEITPRTDSHDDETTVLNQHIVELYNSLSNDGKPVSLVDHNSAFKSNSNWVSAYMADDKHPDNAGYGIMADVYFDALQNLLGGNSEVVQTPVYPDLVTSHSVDLGNLLPDHEYSFRVISRDLYGNETISGTSTFMTLADASIYATFDSGTEGFEFDDSNNHPQYADGSYSSSGNPGGSLEILLGGVDDTSYSDGNEAGWRITVSGGGDITISGDYYITLPSTFESDEFGEARLRVDGDLYGENGEIYLGHEDGGSGTVNTGWTSFVINLSSLPNTTHTIDFLGFNNKKTRSNEELTIGFDNITISGSQQSLALMKTSAGEGDSFETEVDYKNEIVGNYPNPFNPTTKILFTLEQDSDVKVIIYNILGREVIRLFDGFKQKGASNLEWLGVNAYGLPVATGTYILSIQTPHWSAAHKMKIVK